MSSAPVLIYRIMIPFLLFVTFAVAISIMTVAMGVATRMFSMPTMPVPMSYARAHELSSSLIGPLHEFMSSRQANRPRRDNTQRRQQQSDMIHHHVREASPMVRLSKTGVKTVKLLVFMPKYPNGSNPQCSAIGKISASFQDCRIVPRSLVPSHIKTRSWWSVCSS